MTENFAEVRRQLAALEERVRVLEDRSEPSPEPFGASAGSAVDAQEQFWALEGLRSRRGDHPSTVDGAVMIVGDVTLPDGAPVSWQQGAGTTGMLESDWSDHSAAFAALGHPVRLELLRHILSGVHTTAELAEIASLGTTGQLHHHLRQLVAAGWVRQAGRGSYEIPVARIVPLLACLAGAQR